MSEENTKFMMRAKTVMQGDAVTVTRQQVTRTKELHAHHITWENVYHVVGSASETRALSPFHPVLPRLH